MLTTIITIKIVVGGRQITVKDFIAPVYHNNCGNLYLILVSAYVLEMSLEKMSSNILNSHTRSNMKCLNECVSPCFFD